MSCQHGNWRGACDLCDELDDAFKRGCASRDEEVADLKKAYELLFKENAALKEQLNKEAK